MTGIALSHNSDELTFYHEINWIKTNKLNNNKKKKKYIIKEHPPILMSIVVCCFGEKECFKTYYRVQQYFYQFAEFSICHQEYIDKQ